MDYHSSRAELRKEDRTTGNLGPFRRIDTVDVRCIFRQPMAGFVLLAKKGERIQNRKADQFAVEAYTGTSYGAMNRALRSGCSADEETQQKIQALVRALMPRAS